MKLYTKTGDNGMTSLLNGERVPKNDLRIQLAGTYDELTSYLGLIKTKLQEEHNKQFIELIQVKLVTIMAHCVDIYNEKYFFDDAAITEIEEEIDRLAAFLPKTFTFVLPGANEVSALIHIARTVARRAERLYTGLFEDYPANASLYQYINRLSDYLYALGRYYENQ